MRQSISRAVNEGVGQLQQLRRRASESSLNNAAMEPSPRVSDEGRDHKDPLLLDLLHNARSTAVRDEFLRLPAETYTADHEIKILASTYNVNGQTPSTDLSLTEWLGGGRHADLEVVPLNASNVVLGGSGENVARWDALVADTLNAGLSPPRAKPVPDDGREGRQSQARDLSARLSDVRLTDAAESGGESTLDREANADAAAPAAGARWAAADPSAALTNGTDPSPAAEDGVEYTPPEPSVSSPAFLSPGTSSTSDQEYQSGDESLDTRIDGDPAAFVQVAARQLVGIYLSIWVRASLLPHVHGIQILSVATGMMGYLGNKGAVAIRMRLYDTGVCFVSSHLASGENPGDEAKRHYDHAEILRRGYFGDATTASVARPTLGAATGSLTPDVQRVAGPAARGGHWGPALSHMMATQHVFWMGDLNYRLHGGGAGSTTILKAIAEGELESLLARDQLLHAMRSGAAFAGWQEAPIRFPPTFKFKRGSPRYLGQEGEGSASPGLGTAANLASRAAEEGVASIPPLNEAGKAGTPPERPRAPAWTDRILFKSQTPHLIKQTAYMSAQGIQLSDHRPVSAAYLLVAHEYLRHEIEAAIDVARRLVDAKEMAATPHCQLSPTSVDLGVLGYNEAKEVELTLRNEGQAPAIFQVVPTPGGQSCPWLEVVPSQGSVPAGGRRTVTLRAQVSGGPGGCADALLSSRACSLDAVLVLRVARGNDMFLAVGGAYRPSWMGLRPRTLAERGPYPMSKLWQAGEDVGTGSEDGAAGDEGAEAGDEGAEAGDSEAESSGAAHAGAAAAGSGSGPPPERTPGVPLELARLIEALEEEEALGTPGLFMVDACELAPGTADPEPLAAIREALDRGAAAWPRGVGPCDLAAALLAALAALPEPVLPEGAKALCDVASHTTAATAMGVVRGSLSGPRLELFERVLGLLRAALAPRRAERNGLAPAALAVVLAEVMFPPLPREMHAAGGGLGDAAARGLGAAAENLAAIGMRRIRFIQHLLTEE
ncbi:hypothetical protein ACKKBF_B33235 [Auxenochlorella protothecoides x Auxenochlorella symbiontica]